MKKSLVIALLAFFVFTSFQPSGLLTRLKVTVIDDIGNPVENARVQLYGKMEDYRDDKNPVTDEKLTDDEGEVIFGNLDPEVYYVSAYKDSLSNHGTAIQTDTLAKMRTNTINVVIK